MPSELSSTLLLRGHSASQNIGAVMLCYIQHCPGKCNDHGHFSSSGFTDRLPIWMSFFFQSQAQASCFLGPFDHQVISSQVAYVLSILQNHLRLARFTNEIIAQKTQHLLQPQVQATLPSSNSTVYSFVLPTRQPQYSVIVTNRRPHLHRLTAQVEQRYSASHVPQPDCV